MKTYEKPLVMVNNDLAEGVFAASGGTSVTVPTLRITSDNGFGYGQAVFDYNFGDLVGKNVVMKVVYNKKIDHGWTGATGNHTVNGNTLVISYSQAPSNDTVYIDVQSGGISGIEITAFSVGAE